MILLCPIPSVIEDPSGLALPVLIHEYIPEPKGSAQIILISLFFCFKPIEVPARVPPVPTAATNPSISLFVCFQSSKEVLSI